MNPSDPPASSEEAAAKPGKMRTWWHPLLVNLLRWQLGSHYHIHDEVPVGTKPLQIDILLLDQAQGELPPYARVMLAGLVERLGASTLIEFKSPADTLRAGDLQTFLAYALLYRMQRDPLLATSKLHLIVIAPQLTKPYRKEMQILNVTERQEEPGVWRLQGGMAEHPMWLLETNVLAGAQHPLMTVCSPLVRRDARQVYESLTGVGYNKVVVYMCQQIHEFVKAGKEFAMQHLGAETEMPEIMRALWESFSMKTRLDLTMHDPVLAEEYLQGLPAEERLKGLPAEERLKGLPAEERLKGLPAEERLKGLPAEERLKGLPAEERLKGLPAEELLKGLTPERREQLRKLLQEPEAEKSNDG